jgi:uncharacterized protein YaiE (UPF0345 family)
MRTLRKPTKPFTAKIRSGAYRMAAMGAAAVGVMAMGAMAMGVMAVALMAALAGRGPFTGFIGRLASA